MRIVFVNPLGPGDPGAGGAEATLALLAEGLAARGHETILLALTREPAPPCRVGARGVRPVPLQNADWPIGPGSFRKKLLRPAHQALEAWNPPMRIGVARHLRDLRPDVVTPPSSCCAA